MLTALSLFTDRALIQAAFHLKETAAGSACASFNEFEETMRARSQTC